MYLLNNAFVAEIGIGAQDDWRVSYRTVKVQSREVDDV